MNLRRALGGVAVGAAATVAANRALADRAGALPPPLVGDQHVERWRGFEVEYTEAGDPEDPDVVLLHGVHAAGTSQEFDGVFDALAAEYHVLAPDLPGFGRSDRPPATYTAGLYEAFVREFLREHAEDPVCVATSLTGAYAVAAAEAAGVDRLVLVCPTADTGGRRPLLRSLLRSPVLGEGLFNLLTARASLEWFDGREAYDGPVDRRTVDYQWRTAHQPGARFAPASFVGGYLDPDLDLGAALAALASPVTLVWGREATRPPLAAGRALAERADARLVVVDHARSLPHAEHPDAFLRGLDRDLPRLEG